MSPAAVSRATPLEQQPEWFRLKVYRVALERSKQRPGLKTWQYEAYGYGRVLDEYARDVVRQCRDMYRGHNSEKRSKHRWVRVRRPRPMNSRPRGAGRPAARRTATASRGSPDDPSELPPHLDRASCPACGFTLVYVAEQLVCPRRYCSAYLSEGVRV